MNRSFRRFLLYSARKVGRHRALLFTLMMFSMSVGLFLSILAALSLSFGRPQANRLAVHLTAGDATPVGAEAYARGWVGFPALHSRVNCSQALTDPKRNFMYPQAVPRVTLKDILAQCRNSCKTFAENNGFNRHPKVTKEELHFPIAFIILFHKDLDQVLFLLRAIYRPHNVYCLSVDLSATQELIEATLAVSGCLQNVFVASKLENIVYAGFSRLMADVHCMADLFSHRVKWNYVINMPGQQFPLKSNLEMVRILKLYNGANDVLGDIRSRYVPRRYLFKHHVMIGRNASAPTVAESVHLNPPPPHGFRIVKGSAYNTLSRAFVKMVLRHQWVKDLISWSRDVESPDEYFWATLNHASEVVVPGSFVGVPENKPWITSYTAWQGLAKCASKFVRWICIFSPGDLPNLVSQVHLFANKFYIDHHPAALHCLDQYIYNLTVSGTVRGLEYYRALPFLVPYDNFDE
ncbi:hypothetical protein EGW08_018174 [Elysia chlorotica]|uniref:Uncharacterized protein n=1 Tax=Elysia chlorotica TaxID=188477 RepID=A0A3S1B3F2_ELYCH|nr:hypothetical protein EGW08_018174 [Elysia chlorotica]